MTPKHPNSKNPPETPDTPSEALDQLTGMLDSVAPCLTKDELEQLSVIEHTLREALTDE